MEAETRRPASAPLLDVRDLSVEYLTPRGPVRAVERASFTLNPGEVVGLAGESGSGKSTIAHALLRILPPPALITGGRVLFGGQDVLAMTQSELERFPPLGEKSGDFQQLHPGQYRNFRWQLIVEPTAVFPDVRKVKVRIIFGPRFTRRFELVEYLHSPLPPQTQ